MTSNLVFGNVRKNIINPLLLACLVLAGALVAPAQQTNAPADKPAEKPADKPAAKLVEPADAKKLIDDKKVVVLDVRTPEEFAVGHIAGAVNLDSRDKEFAAKIAKLDKSKAYLVHCSVGFRSVRACDAMTQLDFKSLYDLKGGISAWQKAGLPVEK